MDLIGEEILIFREELLKSTEPATIKELRSKITKPEEPQKKVKRL